MDNPEYILDSKKQRNSSSRQASSNAQQQQQQQQPGNYHTLGIPLVNNSSSPNSSQGPSSIHSAPGHLVHPYTSITSTGSHAVVVAGLNGVINDRNGPVPRTPGAASHQRSSAGEDSDDHDYYNDLDRLKRERQPLHPTRTASSNGSSSVGSGGPTMMQPPPMSMAAIEPPLAKHETTV
jgi:hypothetical protein